jgi:hypothetical protein
LLAALTEERGPVARGLTEARSRLTRARVAVANVKFEAATPFYATAAADFDTAGRQAEAALGQALARCVDYGRARKKINSARRQLFSIAREGAGDSKEVLGEIAHLDHIGSVPVSLSDESVVASDGPEFEIFGDDSLDPALYQSVGEFARLAVTDPDRAIAQLRGTRLGQKAGL